MKHLKKTNNEIIKVLEYDNDFAYEQILKALSVAWRLNKTDKRIDDIMELVESKNDFPIFLRTIDSIVEAKDNISMKYMKSPPDLQGHTIASIYYALFIALDLTNKDYMYYKNNKSIVNICKIAIKYHISYVKYKNNEKKNSTTKQKDTFFEKCAIVIIRIIEILTSFSLQKENHIFSHLEKIYFQTKNDLEIHFYNIISDISELESSYFKIKNDFNFGNYIAYSNYKDGIEIQIESSRKMKRGSGNKNEENKNITKFLIDDFKSYLKLINIELKATEQNKRGGYTVTQGKTQETEEDELLNSIWLQNKIGNTNLAKEDLADAYNKTKKFNRNYSNDEESKKIPNLYKQRQRNKAFSSKITKRALLLPSSYDIPSLDLLKIFLNKQFSQNIEIEKKIDGVTSQNILYDGIFLLDLLLGIGYKRIIDLLTKKGKEIKLNTKTDIITINIKKKLFGQYEHELLYSKNKEKIVYSVPSRIILLIERLKEELSSSDTINSKELENEPEANKYFSYIKDKIKLFDKKIYFDPKHMWRLISSYIREKKKEDMSSMFCIGRYQQNDTPRLAYSSTPEKSQVHSKYIEELYIMLDYHNILGKFLALEESDYVKYFEFDEIGTLSGSKLAVKQEIAVSFFNSIKKLINYSSNNTSDTFFNLVSIYTRYALSLLLGTRDYTMSVSLERYSSFTSTLIITEKGTTLLNGLRIIPLCKKAKQIIKDYQSLCSRYGINGDNIYLRLNNKFEIYKQNRAKEICIDANLSEEIIEFVGHVPLNTGRHVITQQAIMQNFNLHYLEALMGHYISGGEQFGRYSTLNIPNYIKNTQIFLDEIANEYKI